MYGHMSFFIYTSFKTLSQQPDRGYWLMQYTEAKDSLRFNKLGEFSVGFYYKVIESE
jgi:hypothetical protein